MSLQSLRREISEIRKNIIQDEQGETVIIYDPKTGIPKFTDDKIRIFIPEDNRDRVRIFIPDNGRDPGLWPGL